MQDDLSACQDNRADPERTSKMNNHRWLGLVLVVLAAGWLNLPAVQAQWQRRSHKPVNTELGESLSPEELVARRLRKSQRLGLDPKDLNQLQELAKRVLKHKELLESLAEDFDSSAIRKLLEQLDAGKQIDDGGLLKDFLEKAGKSQSFSAEKDLLKSLGEKMKASVAQGKTPETGTINRPSEPRPTSPGAGGAMIPGTKPGPAPVPDKDLQERLAGWLKDAAKRWADPKWLDSMMGPAWRDTLADLAKRASQARVETSRLTNRARGLTRWFPRVSRYFPKSLGTRPRSTRLPSMPRMGSMPGAPRLSGVSGSSAAGMAKLLLWMGALGVLAFVLFRVGGWWEKLSTMQTAGWQLGPWPVRPGDVMTRGDLVLAFEHLALTCLGPEALTCHHLELGQRIGERPALDGDRRREASATLARLYEQARYTPDDEIMSPETMACARRELCYLAGVAA
jgi:hypothetical protein